MSLSIFRASAVGGAGAGAAPDANSGPSGAASKPGAQAAASSTAQLSSEELVLVSELAVTDQHVRAHEQAHLAAAGPYATGGPSYGYTTGPDGRQYATSGEVSMDVTPDPSSPEETIKKARTVQAAANAPADPSSQDRAVAAAAAQMEQTAERELAALQTYAAAGAADPATSGGRLSMLM
jgi:hypothetical protein